MPSLTKPLIVIPARAGSKGIPGKNFRHMAGRPLVHWALEIAEVLGWPTVLTTDSPDHPALTGCSTQASIHVRSGKASSDEAGMADVLLEVLAAYPKGDPVVLLQPTSPLRTAVQVHRAVKLLRLTQADSVVSVSPLPMSQSPEQLAVITGGRMYPYLGEYGSTRQSCTPVYERNGHVYTFWRRTLLDLGSLYGPRCYPLVIPAGETCSLDTPEDWDQCELLLARRMA